MLQTIEGRTPSDQLRVGVRCRGGMACGRGVRSLGHDRTSCLGLGAGGVGTPSVPLTGILPGCIYECMND
jgi:hypothetical protein